MSGGPDGRGKAERTCMKLAHWPKADGRLWLAALAPTDPFADGGGTRAGHRPISNRNVQRGYGRFLTFLGAAGRIGRWRQPDRSHHSGNCPRVHHRTRPARKQEGHHPRPSGRAHRDGQGSWTGQKVVIHRKDGLQGPRSSRSTVGKACPTGLQRRTRVARSTSDGQRCRSTNASACCRSLPRRSDHCAACASSLAPAQFDRPDHR